MKPMYFRQFIEVTTPFTTGFGPTFYQLVPKISCTKSFWASASQDSRFEKYQRNKQVTNIKMVLLQNDFKINIKKKAASFFKTLEPSYKCRGVTGMSMVLSKWINYNIL